MLEGLVLSVVAAGLGLLIAWDLLLFVRQVSPPDVPRLRNVHFDVLSFGLSALVAIGTGLAATSIPAVRLRFDEPWILFKTNEPGPNRSRPHHSLTVLAVLEVAVAVVLVAWASLLVGNFVALNSADHGFDATGLVTFKTSGAESHAGALDEHWKNSGWVGEAIEGLSNITSFAEARPIGLAPAVEVDGRPLSAGVPVRSIGPGYFATLGARMVRGREFTRADATGLTPAALVNQRFVEQFGEGAEILGRSLTVNSRTALTIVGVAPSVQEGRPDAPVSPEIYLPLDGRAAPTTWYVRATGHLQAADVRRAISRLAPGVTMYDFAPAVAIQREAIAVDRMYALVASSFAAVSLLFAALGLSGLVSSAISARWSEFGVRCAFGAAAGSIHRSLARRALVVVGAGLLLGVVAAVLAARFVPWRPNAGMPTSSPIGIGLALLSLAVALAAYLPLRRVTRLDPSAVLKWQ